MSVNNVICKIQNFIYISYFINLIYKQCINKYLAYIIYLLFVNNIYIC